MKNLPEPIPAYWEDWQLISAGRKWESGRVCCKDAVLRAFAVSRQAGIRAVAVHALTEEAKGFYRHYGFRESPLNQMILMPGLADWEKRFIL